MTALAIKAGWFAVDVAADLLVIFLFLWPLNFLWVLFVVWIGIPAAAGWPDPTLTQSTFIAMGIALLDSRRRRK